MKFFISFYFFTAFLFNQEYSWVTGEPFTYSNISSEGLYFMYNGDGSISHWEGTNGTNGVGYIL